LRQIKNVENHYNGIKERKENERVQKIETAQKMYNEVYKLVNKIREDYKENQEGLVKLVDYYENTFEYNQKIMVELASQLVNKLVANTFTKNTIHRGRIWLTAMIKSNNFWKHLAKKKSRNYRETHAKEKIGEIVIIYTIIINV